MRRLLALGMVVAIAGGACTDNGDDSPDPTVPTAVSTAPPTTVVGVDTIPGVIDEPYLNRVLAALDRVETSAVQVIMDTKRVPPEATAILNSIYSNEWITIVVDSWVQQIQRDPQLAGLKRPLGDRHSTVERVISSSPSCVWMAIQRDYSDSDVRPPPTRTEYMALRPLDPANNAMRHNPTAWMIVADGYNEDGSEPVNECSPAG